MKHIKQAHFLIVMTLFLLVAVMTGCSNQTPGSLNESTAANNSNEKLSIVASLFPHYDFAKAIAGDYADVSLILPPGIESHSYEPTPKDLIKITASDLFLYTSADMEPWAQALIETINKNETIVIDMSAGVKLMASDGHIHEDETETGEDAHEEGAYDPHYWLDLDNAIMMVETIRQALIEAMPAQKYTFEANAAALILELQKLDLDFAATFEKTQSKTILSGGHFAFGYFAKRYGLENMSPYVGFSPDAEPTPRRITDLIDTIKRTKAKAIFYEELINPRVAKIISEEAGVEMLLLHGAHNISKDELINGTTYIEIMKGNLERLKIGLGYVE